MTIQKKYLLIIILVAGAIGAAISAKFVSSRTVTKTRLVNHDVIHDHVVTVVHEVDKPGGTKDITTTTTNDSTSQGNSVQFAKDNGSAVSTKYPTWNVSAGIGFNFSDNQKVYKLEVDRQILGPLSVGAWGMTDSTVGLSVSYGF